MGGIRRWLEEPCWIGSRMIALKSLLYVLFMVGIWSVLNSYHWSVFYIFKETATIWFVGSLSYILAKGVDKN